MRTAMKWITAAVLGSLTVCLAATEDPGKQWVHVEKTEHADFAPGGTIRIAGSHGDLNIEGWDRPEVEVVVSKSTLGLYKAQDVEQARERLDRIGVKLTKKSPSELILETQFPSRTLRRWFRGKSDLMMEYQVHVPKSCNLVIHHDTGTVLVTEVGGDVEAHVGAGDIVLMLPQSQGYSIDAKTNIGNVESDFGGAAAGKDVVGRKLAFAPASMKHRILLRVDIGGITVKSR